MKYYVGIDIGKYTHQAILCNEEAKPLAQSIRFHATYEGYQLFILYLKKVVDPKNFGTVSVGMEATGSYWLSLYEKLKKLGFSVVVLNPLQVKAYRNEGIRGAKNDRLDAQLIVKVLRFGDYKISDIPKEDIFALRQLTRLRSDLVGMTTDLKLKTISIFDQVFPEYKDLFYDIFATTSKALLDEAVIPQSIRAISTKKLTLLLEKASRGRQGEKEAKHIKTIAEQSIGVTIGLDAFTLSLKILLTQITHLEEETAKLDKEIMERVQNQATTLTTIPGIGVITSGTIIAEIGNFERFKDDKDGAEKLVALAGIDPRVKESGKYKGKAKMSKRGSPYLRQAVRQAAFVAACGLRHDPMFAALYQKKIQEGKPFEVALSHVENKMLHVIFSLLKSKKEYKPNT
jgi:transposase